MSLEFRYEYANNLSTSLGSNVVRFGGIALSENAKLGVAAVSQIAFDDPTAVLDIVGLRQFRVSELAAASNSQLIGKFRIDARSYARADSMRTGAARRITVDLTDYNKQLFFRLFTDADANRPAETAAGRLAWLLTNEAYRIYAHPTLCSAPATAMDPNDYRGGARYADVLGDIANVTGYNFWAAYDEGRERTEVFLMDPASTSYTSTISISNDAADVDSVTVFAPSEDAELRRSPERITAGALVAYEGGWVYERSAATAANWELVDQTAPVSSIKSQAKARSLAQRYLADNDEEDDIITCSIVVPAAQVNDVRHGHRIFAKFTHFPDYESGLWMRVTSRTVIQDEDIGQDYYRIQLELSRGAGEAYTCSTALVGRETAENEQQYTTSPTVTSTITPTFDGRIMSYQMGENQNTPSATNMTAPSGYTVLLNKAAHSKSTYVISHKAASAGVAATASSTYTPGFGNFGAWTSWQVAFRTAATTPVQDKWVQGIDITLDAAPTAGNIVFLLCIQNSLGGITQTPPSGFTTVLAYTFGVEWNVGLYAHCVEAGESGNYVWTNGGGATTACATHVVEWVIS